MRHVAMWGWLALAGCAGTPPTVEVTEPWTSGDEAAVGVEETTLMPDASTGPRADEQPSSSQRR
ncbi:MAG: hypothetical protein OHK0013_02060 [Sandaracinaceae bacterium]